MLTRRPPLIAGIVAAALDGVALTTLLVYALDDVAPVLSLGVVYLLVVLRGGDGLGRVAGAGDRGRERARVQLLSTSRPPGSSRSPTGENWVGLIVFFLAAAGGRAGSRRSPASGSSRPTGAGGKRTCPRRWRGCCCAAAGAWRRRCPTVGARLAQALGAEAARRSSCARSTRASAASPSRCARAGAPDRHLGPPGGRARGRRCGVCRSASPRRWRRCWPRRWTVTRCRARWWRPRALRRSDVIKTALLRSVSHDLRSPLTAILTSAEALRSPSLTDAERGELAEACRRRGEPALAPDRRSAGPLPSGGRRRRAEAGVVLGGRGGAGGDRGTPQLPAGAFKVSIDADLPPVRADAAQLERAFAPARERPAAFRRPSRVPCARGTSAGASCCASWTAGRASRPPSASQLFEPFYRSRDDRHRPPRLRPRAGDRARVRGGQRRQGLGRVAPQPGDLVRGRTAARAASVPGGARTGAPSRPRCPRPVGQLAGRRVAGAQVGAQDIQRRGAAQARPSPTAGTARRPAPQHRCAARRPLASPSLTITFRPAAARASASPAARSCKFQVAWTASKDPVVKARSMVSAWLVPRSPRRRAARRSPAAR